MAGLAAFVVACLCLLQLSQLSLSSLAWLRLPPAAQLSTASAMYMGKEEGRTAFICCGMQPKNVMSVAFQAAAACYVILSIAAVASSQLSSSWLYMWHVASLQYSLSLSACNLKNWLATWLACMF